MQSWTLLILYATLGTGHCMAMCGGLAILATRGASSRRGLISRLVFYLSGKALTYFFLVLTLGLLTDWAREWLNLANLSYYLGLGVGVSMILFGGWQAWKFIRFRRSGIPYRNPGEEGCRVNGKLRLMKSPFSAFILGWGNGFLPCGFLWLALIYISQWQGIGQQLLGVLVFSLMTSPGLIAAVGVSRLFRGQWLRWSLPASAGALVLYGLVLMSHALGLLPHSVHQALTPVSLPISYSHENGEEEWCAPLPD